MFVILVNRWFARIVGVQMYKRFDVPRFDFETQWKLKHSTNTHYENRTRQDNQADRHIFHSILKHI